MSLSTKIERTNRGPNLEKRCQFSPNWNTVKSYLELQILDFNLVYMARKLRHRPKTFIGVQDSILLSGSPNLSNNGEVRICPAAQTLFSVQTISRVLEVQMHRFFFCWKAEMISQNFHADNLFKLLCYQQIIMLSMMFCSDKKIRIVTKSRCGHPLNNQSSN